MVNLRGVDLNLLTVFEAVYEERSQIRAAQRLGMTQPAVSAALSRLRYWVGDRLFQGRAKGLTATAKADDLYAGIHAALDIVRRELGSHEEFDPASSRQSFVITVSYGGGALIGMLLFQHIREIAPGIRLTLRNIDPNEEIPGLLREHRMDLAIHHARLDDTLLEHTDFVTFNPVVVARADHPRVEAAVGSRESLLEEEFVRVYDHANGLAQHPELRPVIEMLRNRIVLEVPSSFMLPWVVSQTDLLAIMPRQLADVVGRLYGLKHYPAPFDLPPIPTYLIWHPSRRDDPAHGWLRQQCRVVAEKLRQFEDGTGPALP